MGATKLPLQCLHVPAPSLHFISRSNLTTSWVLVIWRKQVTRELLDCCEEGGVAKQEHIQHWPILGWDFVSLWGHVHYRTRHTPCWCGITHYSTATFIYPVLSPSLIVSLILSIARHLRVPCPMAPQLVWHWTR